MRGKFLAGLMDRSPTVRQLVVSDWFAIEQVEYARDLQTHTERETPPTEQMAVMLAMAYYFIFYLHKK